MQLKTKLSTRILPLFLVTLLLFTGCTDRIKSPPNLSSQSTESPTEPHSQSTDLPDSPPDTNNEPDNPAPPPPANGELIISYLNVGQGDCTFILLPNGESMLIDAGNAGDGGDIISYIQKSGTGTLDYVIATHPHADHIGSMSEVISAFDVKNIYMPKVSHTSLTFETLLDTIEAKGLTVKSAKAGRVLFSSGGLTAELLAPKSDRYSGLNNYSAVLMLTYGEKHFMFMGDAENESESEILSGGAAISADVLKVGHHGSDTSSGRSFIEAVRPAYAVISVGAGNRYGHPDQETLNTLAAVNAEIWRTDERGTIVVSCDGKNITISGTGTSSPPPEGTTPETITAPEESSSAPDDGQNITVYITKSGTKYHRDGCRFLNDSKIPVKLSELDTKKYTPCSVCKPDTAHG